MIGTSQVDKGDPIDQFFKLNQTDHEITFAQTLRHGGRESGTGVAICLGR